MRYIAAYLLAVQGGNENPSADDIRKIINSVGIDTDEEKLQLVMEKLQNKNLEEIQTEGLARLATVVMTGNQTRTDEKADHTEDKPEPDINNSDSESDESEDGFIGNIFGD